MPSANQMEVSGENSLKNIQPNGIDNVKSTNTMNQPQLIKMLTEMTNTTQKQNSQPNNEMDM